MKNQYQSPHYHRNETTLFLNPAKKFLIKKKKGSKIRQFTLVLVLLLSIFIGYSAYAGGMKDEGWVTEIDDDGVSVKHHGNITHGDDIIFFLSKNDCNAASWISKVYTMAENNFAPLVEKSLPYKLQSYSNKSDYGYTTAQILTVRPFLNGHRALIYFGNYPIDRYLQWFRSGDEYYFEIVKADKNLIDREYGQIDEDILTIEPTDYFDIQMNAYYFEGFNKTLVDAQKKCNDLGIFAKA